jgi:hypothetical protein
VWDLDLTTSDLFTLFAWVALLANSRTVVDVDANLLVLSAIGVAVVDGFRLLAQDPQGRAALRRLAVYSMLALGSTSFLFVFNRRMGTRALPHTNTLGRDPFVLSMHSDFYAKSGYVDSWFTFFGCGFAAYALFFVLHVHIISL